MLVLILHHVGELMTNIGLFNYPKIQDEILPWETTNEVSEFKQDYDTLEFTTKKLGGYSETSYSVKRTVGFHWEGSFKHKTGKTEIEGNCTCLVFD